MTDRPDPVAVAPVHRLRDIQSSLPIALLRARGATAAKFKRHTDAVGLSQPQWRVMRALAAGAPLDVRSLAEQCVLLQPSVSRLLRSLEDRGLITTIDGADARRRLLALTPKGQAVFEHVAVVSEAVYRDLEVAYGRDQLETLIHMLTRLREVAEGLPDLPRVMPDLPPLPKDM
ncbi:MAG: MarR family transcriptional regulator [Gemmobacter sp.]|jgi:homoprotocatechuate degradation regulator HpaR|nr:MarR family transcriptional regulator [Gemmobacter sp.]